MIIGYTIYAKNYLLIFLKYAKDGSSLIKELKIISKPGRRIFKGYKYFISKPNSCKHILSTSKGILLDNCAISKKCGGRSFGKIYYIA